MRPPDLKVSVIGIIRQFFFARDCPRITHLHISAVVVPVCINASKVKLVAAFSIKVSLQRKVYVVIQPEVISEVVKIKSTFYRFAECGKDDSGAAAFLAWKKSKRDK